MNTSLTSPTSRWTTSTFLAALAKACQAQYQQQRAVPPIVVSPDMRAVAQVGLTARSLHRLWLDLQSERIEATKARDQAARKVQRLQRSGNGDLAATGARLTELGAECTALAGHKKQAASLTQRQNTVVELLCGYLGATVVELASENYASPTIDENGILYVEGASETAPKFPLGQNHLARKAFIHAVLILAGEDRHVELGLPDELAPFPCDFNPATEAEAQGELGEFVVKGTVDDPVLRRFAALITTIGHAPIGGELSLATIGVNHEALRFVDDQMGDLQSVFWALVKEYYDLSGEDDFRLRGDWAIVQEEEFGFGTSDGGGSDAVGEALFVHPLWRAMQNEGSSFDEFGSPFPFGFGDEEGVIYGNPNCPVHGPAIRAHMRAANPRPHAHPNGNGH